MNDTLYEILSVLQSCEHWLFIIACFFFIMLIVGTTFVFCKVVYKLLMRFA